MAEEGSGRWRSYVSGPRWMGLKEFIYDGAVRYHLEIDSLEQDKGWINETIYFTVSGTESNVNGFRTYCLRSMEEYNGDA